MGPEEFAILDEEAMAATKLVYVSPSRVLTIYAMLVSVVIVLGEVYTSVATLLLGRAEGVTAPALVKVVTSSTAEVAVFMIVREAPNRPETDD